MAIRDRLTDGSVALTRSNLKVARALLSDYPAAGLNTVAHLAALAGVSGPSVVRFVVRLGFEGFPEFQKMLLTEVQERMNSPLAMIDAGKAARPRERIWQDSVLCGVELLEQAAAMVPAADFDAAVALIAEPRHRVHFIGGRFSGYLAGMLWAHIHLLRRDCRLVSGTRSDQIDSLVDFGRRDVVVVYDYRRYQLDTIRFAAAASRQGARIILFTDPWASPIAADAEVIMTAPVEGPSPFDTLVPALAQTEALIAAVTARLGSRSRDRIERIEALRHASGITENPLEPAPDPAGARPPARPRTMRRPQ